MKKLTMISTLIIFILLMACNGGSGGGETTETTETTVTTETTDESPKTYHLDEPDLFESGFLAEFDLAGSSIEDNTGTHSMTGTYSLKTIGLNDYGELQIDHLQELHNPENGRSINTLTSYYYDQDTKKQVGFSDGAGDELFTIAKKGDKPDMAEIGDFGILDTIVLSDGTEIVGNWKLTAGANGLAKIESYKYYSRYDGSWQATIHVIETIDESGYVHSVYKKTETATIIITMTGKRTK